MNLPEVSIVVPVFNAEKYLSRCIDSIISQTFINFECILVDDGSTDSSLKICEHYSQSDDRIILIHQKNSGVSATRNKGIEIAKGRYVCFVDSDDYIKSNMYEELVSGINKSDTDVICCGYIENNKICTLTKEDFIFDKDNVIEVVHYLEMGQAFGIVYNKLYKKTILDNYKIRFFNSIKFGEDMLFSLNYFRHVKSALISSGYYYYYVHENLGSVTKHRVSFDECTFRFENVSNIFRELDNNNKSLCYSELLAKDFVYTVALLLRLYSEKKKSEERLLVINKLKKFYTENRAKNKFRTTLVAITYKMLTHFPAKLFNMYFSTVYITFVWLVKVGKGNPRFVSN